MASIGISKTLPILCGVIVVSAVLALAACTEPKCQPGELRIGTTCRPTRSSLDGSVESPDDLDGVEGLTSDGGRLVEPAVMEAGAELGLVDGSAVPAPSEPDALLDKLPGGPPAFQFRADTVILNGDRVSRVLNLRGSDALTVPFGMVSAPTANSAFGGAQTLALSEACLRSTLPAPTWNFLHKGEGEGYELFLVGRRTGETGSNQAILTTRAGGGDPGLLIYTSDGVSTASYYASDNAGTAIVNVTTLDWATQAATYFNVAHAENAAQEVLAFSKDVNKESLSTAKPGTNDAAGTLQVGNISANTSSVQPAAMEFAELLIFPRMLHEYERQLVREYIEKRYGIVAPRLEAADREIMSLLPFSWIDAASHLPSGGKVLAFTDRARPGHTFGQANPELQVNVPVPSAHFNNAPTTRWHNAAIYESSLPEASWRFLQGLSDFSAYFPALSSSAMQWGCVFATTNLYEASSGIYVSLGRNFVSQDDRAAIHIVNAKQSASPYVWNIGDDASAPGGRSISYSITHRVGVDSRFHSAYSKTVPVNGTPSTAPATGGTLRLGGAYGGPVGFMGEIPTHLFFNRVLNAEEEARLQAALHSKYGVAP